MLNKRNEIAFNVTLFTFIFSTLVLGFIQSKLGSVNGGLLVFCIVYVPLISGQFSSILFGIPPAKENQGGQK